MALARQASSALRAAWKAAASAQPDEHATRALLSCTSIQTVIHRPRPCSSSPVTLETLQRGKSYSWLSSAGELSTSVFTVAAAPVPHHTRSSVGLHHDEGLLLPVDGIPLPNPPLLEEFDVCVVPSHQSAGSTVRFKRKLPIEGIVGALEEQADLAKVSQHVLAVATATTTELQSLCLYFHRKFTLNDPVTFQVCFQSPTLVDGAFFDSHNRRIATVFAELHQPNEANKTRPPVVPTTFAAAADLAINLDSTLQRDIVAGMRHVDFGWKATYGGQLLGQAIWALADGQSWSSFHQHFVRAGQIGRDSEVATNTTAGAVTLSLDGKLIFRGVRVVGRQLPVFPVSSSSSSSSSSTVSSPPPLSSSGNNSDELAEFIMPLSMRNALFDAVDLDYVSDFTRHSNCQRVHVRLRKPAPSPTMNKAVLAYVCDYLFPPTSIAGHNVSVWEGKVKLASFSSSFYYFNDVDWHKAGWITLESHCPVLANGRALVTIDLYATAANVNGLVEERVQIARAVQEVLVMTRKK